LSICASLYKKLFEGEEIYKPSFSIMGACETPFIDSSCVQASIFIRKINDICSGNDVRRAPRSGNEVSRMEIIFAPVGGEGPDAPHGTLSTDEDTGVWEKSRISSTSFWQS
jgi:hypothetical protein